MQLRIFPLYWRYFAGLVTLAAEHLIFLKIFLFLTLTLNSYQLPNITELLTFPATCHIILPHAMIRITPMFFPCCYNFYFTEFVEHWTSAVKIQIWLYTLLVQCVHIFLLLFIFGYVFIYFWHSPYFTAHPTFTTNSNIFLVLLFILLNTSFFWPPASLPWHYLVIYWTFLFFMQLPIFTPYWPYFAGLYTLPASYLFFFRKIIFFCHFI